MTSPERLKGAPDIPTAIEAGLPDMIAQLFTGLFAAGRHAEARSSTRSTQATQKTMHDPAMQKALIDQGLEPIIDSSPDKLRAFMKEELARWTPVLKAAGFTVE